METAMATWTDVTRVMKALPAVVRTRGKREWRVGKKLLAWERPLRAADRKALGAEAPSGAILGVHIPLDGKALLLASQPEVYFTTPHFDGWPAVLVRLPKIPADELSELLQQSWLARAPKKLAAQFLDGG
jgi:hypothetical protein